MSRFLFGHNMQTHNNSLANLCRGVGERVLYINKDCVKPVTPKDGVFEKRLASYRDRLSNGLGWQSPVNYEKFVDYYKGPRRLVYQRAVDGLLFEAVRPRDAMLKTFVKAEKINLSLKSDPVPRVIQPRNPRYNVEVGRYLKPLEHRMYDEIDKLFGSPTIMSAYNSYKQAEIIREKWSKFSDPVCVGLDASRFDQHVSVQALQFEHSIYNRLFRSRKLKWLLRMQLKNYGIARANDGFFRYEKEGSRMSGDMNTSLGNKVLMCLMAHSYISGLNFPVGFVNNGDDCLMITDRKYLNSMEGLEGYFKDFGFNIVRETPVTEFEQIEFCQTKPVCCNGIWRMVRNVRTCLSKDVTCVNLGHDVESYRRLLKDIGTCGLATAADVPVLGAFYRMLVRMGLDGKYAGQWNSEFNWYYTSSLNSRCLHSSPDEYGRYSYWLSTGISPDAQVQLEGYFDESVWGADKRQVINQFFEHLI